jgi:hypothetical protein
MRRTSGDSVRLCNQDPFSSSFSPSGAYYSSLGSSEPHLILVLGVSPFYAVLSLLLRLT